MRLALRRGVLLLVIGGALSACTAPAASLPFTEPAAAVVDGHTISMKAYQARLDVSRHRDPFSGIPEAIPSPAPPQRLETFTIEQLVREEIVRQEAEKRGISASNGALDSRISTLKGQAGTTSFTAALQRNGFTSVSFRSYQRALLIEVALLHAMAKDRADSAARELTAGQTFASVAARWSDDSGQWADAVLIARRTPGGGLRSRITEFKREVLRAVGGFNAGRRADDAQRTADDLFASDQAKQVH